MENNIFNLWTYFVIYSICGWILESIFRSFCEKKLINSGFLNGPFCPIYGIGAIIIFLFLKRFVGNIIVLFLVSFIVLSILEYLVGVGLEKIFKTKYWDYSDHKININGRVCLQNSIYWGILGVIFTKYIHPFVQEQVKLVNPIILKLVIYIITIIFLIDTIISIISIINLKSALKKIEDLNIQIKEKIEELKHSKNKKSNTALIISKENALEKLSKKKDRMLRNLYRRVYRLKKAFPALDTKEITEILNKKIEIIKKKKTSKGEKNGTRNIYY